MIPRRNALLAFCMCVCGAHGFVSSFAPTKAGARAGNVASSGWVAIPGLGSGSRSVAGVGSGLSTMPSLSPSRHPNKLCSSKQPPRAGAVLAMTASDNNVPDKSVIANLGALSFAAGCAAVASAVAEISPHAAAFVQLVCLSIWLGMSVYATFIWPIITGFNLRDSSEFASLLGKLGPSYLQLSVAMIMSLGTSSVVIGHANEVQLVILGIALSITLYNALVLEPSAVVALEEELAVEMAVEKRKRGGNKKKVVGEDLPRMQANVANFLGAEVLLDLLCILCALCYAWDLASSITFA